MKQNLRVLEKSLNVLKKFIYVKDCWGPRELAKEVNISSSSALRILQTLRHGEFLSFDHELGKYVIGPQLWRLGVVLGHRLKLSHIAKPILTKSVTSLNESMYLFSFVKDLLTFDVVIECSHNLRYLLTLGVPYDIHIGAAGKVVLAYLPREHRARLYRTLEESHQYDVQKLREKVRETKEKGYSFTVGERVQGVVGLAAPILGVEYTFLGGVLLTIPEVRYAHNDHGRYAATVMNCAAEISHVVGAAGGRPGTH